MRKITVLFLLSLIGWAALAFCLTGCAGGMFGTGVGDGNVSDFEATVLNVGGEAAGVSGAGTKAQKVLGAPLKIVPRQYPLLGEVTSYWDSVGTVVKPPIHFRVDPDFGSITGTYGQAAAPARPAVDPALQSVIQQAIQDALQGQPVNLPAVGASVTPQPLPATPAVGGDAGSPIAPAIRAVMQ